MMYNDINVSYTYHYWSDQTTIETKKYLLTLAYFGNPCLVVDFLNEKGKIKFIPESDLPYKMKVMLSKIRSLQLRASDIDLIIEKCLNK